MNDKKRKWFLLLLIGGFLLYVLSMKEDIVVAEKSNAKVGFYVNDKKKQPLNSNLPYTGENKQDNELLISGISILLIVTGMISYKTLMNRERI